MKNNKRTREKVGVIVLIVVGIISYLVFSQNGYEEYKVEESHKSFFTVLGNVIRDEGEIKVTEKEINSLGTSYFKRNRELGDIKIEGINVDLGKDKIEVKTPIKYKSLPLLFSTKGKIVTDEKYLIYTPEYFKVGKIKLSSNFVLGLLQEKFSDKILVKDSSIFFGKDKLSKEFEFVKAEENTMILASKGKNNEEIKKIKESIEKAKGEIAGLDKDISLEKVKSDLDSLNSKVSGGKEQQMVSIMSETMNKMNSDPNYNFWGNANKVMEIYKTLTPQEKKAFKEKFFSNVDI